MPVRYPPDERTPARRDQTSTRSRRIVAYEETQPGLLRRVLKRLFSPWVVIPLVFVSAIVLGILIYYWTIFSARIDNLLKGEVFTRSAGIYAAPKQVRTGEAIAPDELVAYLKRAGYVEKNQQADDARGRYVLGDSMVDIEP